MTASTPEQAENWRRAAAGNRRANVRLRARLRDLTDELSAARTERNRARVDARHAITRLEADNRRLRDELHTTQEN